MGLFCHFRFLRLSSSANESVIQAIVIPVLYEPVLYIRGPVSGLVVIWGGNCRGWIVDGCGTMQRAESAYSGVA